MKITLTEDNGTEHDITDSIGFMYDAIIQSLDWGSGFLDLEEQLHIASVGLLAGYEVPGDIDLTDEPRWRDFAPPHANPNEWGGLHLSVEDRIEMDERYTKAKDEWEATYSTRLREAILSQLKQFEMDEDN